MKYNEFNKLYPKMKTNYSFEFQKDKDFLAIDYAAGGGHRAAMDAIIARIKGSNPSAKVFRIDVLNASVTPFIGKAAASRWNRAKHDGDIQKQYNLVKAKYLGLSLQRWGDLVFGPFIFLMVIARLIKNPGITRIVDTQPIGTSAIVLAARFINALFGRNVLVTRIMTDPPTEEASHFSDPVKRLGRKSREVFELVSICPIPQREGENGLIYIDRQEVWWQKLFGLSLKYGEVKYGPPPLRPAFFNPPPEFTIKLYGEEAPKKFFFTKRDFIVFIALGSQAAEAGTIGYINDLVDLVKQKDDGRLLHIFAYCGGETPFFHKIPAGQVPSNVKIHLLGEHNGRERAALLLRANCGIYGAGGITVLENMHLAQGKIFLHSEAKDSNLLNGFALWEKGNAKFLMKTKGAELVSPGKYFKEAFESLLSLVDLVERLPSEEEHGKSSREVEVPVGSIPFESEDSILGK